MREHATADRFVVSADVGANGERLDAASDVSRTDLLKKIVFTGGAAVAGGILVGGLPRAAGSAPSAAQDVRILNFLLGLEYLQAAFYSEASRNGALSGELERLAEVVGHHERAHVAFLRQTLGADAVAEPTFDLGDTAADPDTFLASALALEEAVVAAYIGQGGNLTVDAVKPVVRILPVEGRHTAWIRDISRKNPAPFAADHAKTAAEARAAIEEAGVTTSG